MARTPSDHIPSTDPAQPSWLWDPERLRVVAADAAALRFWGARSLAELSARRFFPDAAPSPELAALAALVDAHRDVPTVLQLAPSGRLASIAALLTREALPDGRAGVRIRHLPASPDTVRGRLLLERAPVAIAAFDAEGRAHFRNRADLELFDADQGELDARFVDRAAARTARAALAEAGAADRPALLRTRHGPRAYRVTLRRIGPPQPLDGAEIAEAAEIIAYAEELLTPIDAADIPSGASSTPAPRPEPAATAPATAPSTETETETESESETKATAPGIGRVARLAETALDAAPTALALFAGADWTLYYDNPALGRLLNLPDADAARLATPVTLASLFPEDADAVNALARRAAESGAGEPVSVTARLRAFGPDGARDRSVALSLRRLDLAEDLAADAIGPILAATFGDAPVEMDPPAAADPPAIDAKAALRLGRAIRTELTSVLGFAESLAGGAAGHDADLARAYLSNIVEGGRRMQDRLEALDAELVATARAEARRAAAARPIASAPAPDAAPAAPAAKPASNQSAGPGAKPEPEPEPEPAIAPPPSERLGETGRAASETVGDQRHRVTQPAPQAPAPTPAPPRPRAGRPPRGAVDLLALLEELGAEFSALLGDRFALAAPPALGDLRARLDAARIQEALRDALAFAAEEAPDPDARAEVRLDAGVTPEGAVILEVRALGAGAPAGDAARARRRAATGRLKISAAAAGADCEIDQEDGGSALLIRLTIPPTRLVRVDAADR